MRSTINLIAAILTAAVGWLAGNITVATGDGPWENLIATLILPLFELVLLLTALYLVWRSWGRSPIAARVVGIILAVGVLLEIVQLVFWRIFATIVF